MNRTVCKVSVDHFILMSNWLLWALSIFIGFNLLSHFIPQINIQFNFLDGATQGAKTYMLVVGIILSLYIPKAYVSQGVARKNVFKGTFIGVSAIALTLALVILLLSGVLSWILGPGSGDAGALSLTYSGLPIHMFLILFFYCVLYFAVGWLIGLSFAARGFISGMLAIAFSILVVIAFESLWGAAPNLPWKIDKLLRMLPGLPGLPGLQYSQDSFPLGLIGSIGLFALVMTVIYFLMRRLPIKP